MATRKASTSAGDGLDLALGFGRGSIRAGLATGCVLVCFVFLAAGRTALDDFLIAGFVAFFADLLRTGFALFFAGFAAFFTNFDAFAGFGGAFFFGTTFLLAAFLGAAFFAADRLGCLAVLFVAFAAFFGARAFAAFFAGDAAFLDFVDLVTRRAMGQFRSDVSRHF